MASIAGEETIGVKSAGLLGSFETIFVFVDTNAEFPFGVFDDGGISVTNDGIISLVDVDLIINSFGLAGVSNALYAWLDTAVGVVFAGDFTLDTGVVIEIVRDFDIGVVGNRIVIDGGSEAIANSIGEADLFRGGFSGFDIIGESGGCNGVAGVEGADGVISI